MTSTASAASEYVWSSSFPSALVVGDRSSTDGIIVEPDTLLQLLQHKQRKYQCAAAESHYLVAARSGEDRESDHQTDSRRCKFALRLYPDCRS